VIPLVVIPAGITYPLSFGGFTSMIPALVPGELLPPANALETTSFNAAIVVGPALAGTLSAVVAPAAPLLVRPCSRSPRWALIVRIPGLDRPPERARERTLWRIAADGLRIIVSVPQLRGVTAAAAFGMTGLGLLTVAFPLFAVEHLDVAPERCRLHVGGVRGRLDARRPQPRARAARLPARADRLHRLRGVRDC
jgi:hypothetical protein